MTGTSFAQRLPWFLLSAIVAPAALRRRDRPAVPCRLAYRPSRSPRAAFDCPTGVRDIFDHPTETRLTAEVERRLVEQTSARSDDEIELSLSPDI